LKFPSNSAPVYGYNNIRLQLFDLSPVAHVLTYSYTGPDVQKFPEITRQSVSLAKQFHVATSC
jgi:hypothetical protein